MYHYGPYDDTGYDTRYYTLITKYYNMGQTVPFSWGKDDHAHPPSPRPPFSSSGLPAECERVVGEGLGWRGGVAFPPPGGPPRGGFVLLLWGRVSFEGHHVHVHAHAYAGRAR